LRTKANPKVRTLGSASATAPRANNRATHAVAGHHSHARSTRFSRTTRKGTDHVGPFPLSRSLFPGSTPPPSPSSPSTSRSAPRSRTSSDARTPSGQPPHSLSRPSRP